MNNKEVDTTLDQFANLLIDYTITVAKRIKRLEKEPKGFPLERGKFYSCIVCHRGFEGHEGWWDRLGPKCISCQNAIDKKVVPKYVCKHDKKHLWLQEWELKPKYGIHPATREKLIREGKLRPREVKNTLGSTHTRLYIIKENPLL